MDNKKQREGDFEQSHLEIIKKAIDSGVSICELGFPTQEASGEGPIIKRAHDHCLKKNITLKKCKCFTQRDSYLHQHHRQWTKAAGHGIGETHIHH